MVWILVDGLHGALEPTNDLFGHALVDRTGNPPRAFVLHSLTNEVLVLGQEPGNEPNGVVEQGLMTIVSREHREKAANERSGLRGLDAGEYGAGDDGFHLVVAHHIDRRRQGAGQLPGDAAPVLGLHHPRGHALRCVERVQLGHDHVAVEEVLFHKRA